MYKRISLLLVVVFVFGLTKVQSDGCVSPPGVVINHIPKSTGKYIGSPSICILPNGDYVASHDEFGPKSSEYRSAITHIFTSNDKGETWKEISRIDGQFWSNLFYHNDALYIMGTNKHHGNLIIRKSTDRGYSWTIPYDAKNGLILEGEYHTAPVPILVYKGRIYRGIEYATAKTTRWGERYSAMVLSASLKSDLLSAKSWTRSNYLPFDNKYLNGEFKAWLEGNIVVTKDKRLVDILRVHAPNLSKEYCAFVDIVKKGKKVNFNSDNFYEMPGGAKKFTIRYDEKTAKYWSIVNYISEGFEEIQTDRVRNTLALISSEDLKTWSVEKVVLHHLDVLKCAFQYVDWQFEEDDIIFVSRTAFDDEEGGARRAHDANFMTFHRIKYRDNTNIKK